MADLYIIRVTGGLENDQKDGNDASEEADLAIFGQTLGAKPLQGRCARCSDCVVNMSKLMIMVKIASKGGLSELLKASQPHR